MVSQASLGDSRSTLGRSWSTLDKRLKMKSKAGACVWCVQSGDWACIFIRLPTPITVQALASLLCRYGPATHKKRSSTKHAFNCTARKGAAWCCPPCDQEPKKLIREHAAFQPVHNSTTALALLRSSIAYRVSVLALALRRAAPTTRSCVLVMATAPAVASHQPPFTPFPTR